MNISRIKIGTKCKLILPIMDLKAGTIGTVAAGSVFHRGNSITDRDGHLWITPNPNVDCVNSMYCICDLDEIEEYLTITRY